MSAGQGWPVFRYFEPCTCDTACVYFGRHQVIRPENIECASEARMPIGLTVAPFVKGHVAFLD